MVEERDFCTPIVLTRVSLAMGVQQYTMAPESGACLSRGNASSLVILHVGQTVVNPPMSMLRGAVPRERPFANMQEPLVKNCCRDFSKKAPTRSSGFFWFSHKSRLPSWSKGR